MELSLCLWCSWIADDDTILVGRGEWWGVHDQAIPEKGFEPASEAKEAALRSGNPNPKAVGL